MKAAYVMVSGAAWPETRVRSGQAKLSCRPKRSGNTRRAEERKERSIRGGMKRAMNTQTTARMMAPEDWPAAAINGSIPPRWAHSRPMVSGCMTWREMYGSGSRTGSMRTIMRIVPQPIRKGREVELAVSSGADLGSAIPWASGLRTATGIRRTTAAVTSGSAVAGIEFFYSLTLFPRFSEKRSHPRRLARHLTPNSGTTRAPAKLPRWNPPAARSASM